MHEALEHEHKGVPMLALAPEPEDLKKEPELSAIVTTPRGCVKLFDVEFTVVQGGPTDKSAG
jgi:hypothetical protein